MLPSSPEVDDLEGLGAHQSSRLIEGGNTSPFCNRTRETWLTKQRLRYGEIRPQAEPLDQIGNGSPCLGDHFIGVVCAYSTNGAAGLLAA
jgi:hypothetical protein